MFSHATDGDGIRYRALPFGIRIVNKYTIKNLCKSAQTLRDYGGEVSGVPAESSIKSPYYPYSTARRYLECINKVSMKSLRAGGPLREYQLRCFDGLKLVISTLQEAGLHPFMNFGTLLGALRHGGFIPWDDDVDLSIMREEWERAYEVLTERFGELDVSDCRHMSDFKAKVRAEYLGKPGKMFVVRNWSAIKLVISYGDSAVVVDVFSCDSYADDVTGEQLLAYRQKIHKVTKVEVPLESARAVWARELASGYPIKIENQVGNPDAKIWYGVDSYAFRLNPFLGFMKGSDIFPLRNIRFEDAELPAPNKAEHFMELVYHNWRRLPPKIEAAVHAGLTGAEF